MNLTEIKNMTKMELIEFLDLYNVEFYPDESKRSLLTKAVDLFWSLKDNNGFTYETVQSFQEQEKHYNESNQNRQTERTYP